MLKQLSLKKCAVVVLATLAVSSANAQMGEITAGVAANQALSGLDGVINNARDAGDYLSMRAAMEAKGVIEAWTEANKDLLNTAVSGLNDQQRSLFNNARQLIDSTNADADERLRQAEAIVNQGNQLINSLPMNKRTYVTQFYPRVLPSQTASTLKVKVKGVNLDAAEPQMTVSNTTAERMIIGPMEVHYTLDLSKVKRDPDKLTVIPLTLTYNNLKDGASGSIIGSREQVQRQIPVVALPTNVGRYSYVAVVETEEKQVKQFTSQPQFFAGSNVNRQGVAKPEAGWQWDWEQGLSAFSQTGHGGEAGKCSGILANASSKDGITQEAHLDSIKKIKFKHGIPKVKWGPGHQNCAVTGPVFKMVKVTKTLPAVAGSFIWTDDARIAIPAGLKSHTLEVTTFDGRKRVFTGSGHDKFFDVLMGPGDPQFVVHPNPPQDI